MAAQAKYTDANNVQDRLELLRSGVRMRSLLGTYGPYSAGQIANIKLRNVGVITHLDVRVTATTTVSSALTASVLAPYNAVSKFSLTDYNTTERVSVPGWMLYFMNSMKNGRPYMPTGQGSVDTQQALAPTANAQTLYANYEIPLAVDPHTDLSGAILAQTVVGEMFLNVTINANGVGSDVMQNPYTAGTGSLGSFYITVWQNYIQPANNRLPLIDLNTIYELAGMYQSTDNIVTNGTKYLDYPNVRSVLGHYFAFVDNNGLAVNGTDIAALNLIANGNTRMWERDPLLTRKAMRNKLGGDLPASLYHNDHRRNPVQTWIYSQVQNALTFGTVTGSPTPYIWYGYESLYLQQTPLPGIAQT